MAMKFVNGRLQNVPDTPSTSFGVLQSDANGGTPPPQAPGMTGKDWGQLGLGLANTYIGFKGLGLAEDQLDLGRQQFAQNQLMARGDEAKQVSTINAERDRRATANAQRQGLAGQARDDFMAAEKAKNLTTVL